MTVKNVMLKDAYGNYMGYGMVKETYGGQEIDIMLVPDISDMLKWWKEWAPVFANQNPVVTDALQQARVLHDITQA
jgi:hypothetical protein